MDPIPYQPAATDFFIALRLIALRYACCADYGIEGPVPEELCAFDKLTEYDVDGGKLEGPIPTWFAQCFPRLREIDLSYNQVGPPSLLSFPLLFHFRRACPASLDMQCCCAQQLYLRCRCTAGVILQEACSSCTRLACAAPCNAACLLPPARARLVMC